MDKVRIITDSTSDLTLEQIKQLDISMLSLKVNIGGKEYADKIDITNDEFYKKLISVKKLPTTTLVSPGEFSAEFAKYPNTPIVVITISSELSGTFQSAVIAREQSGRDDIYIVDSGTGAFALGMLVRAAVKMRDEKRSALEIAKAVEILARRIVIRAAVDTLHYLVMGGRLTNVQGLMGKVLGIKPILTVTYHSLKATERARGMNQAILRIAAHVANEADTTMPISFAHTTLRADINHLMKKTKVGKNCDVYVIGSVIGAHAGPGAIAVAYFTKEN